MWQDGNVTYLSLPTILSLKPEYDDDKHKLYYRTLLKVVVVVVIMFEYEYFNGNQTVAITAAVTTVKAMSATKRRRDVIGIYYQVITIVVPASYSCSN